MSKTEQELREEIKLTRELQKQFGFGQKHQNATRFGKLDKKLNQLYMQLNMLAFSASQS